MKFPINWRIISHPANWFIVLLMVLIAAFAIDIVGDWYKNFTSGESAA